MVKSIKTKLDIIEASLYFWQATSEKEKVGDAYIISIGEFPDMKYVYNDEFNAESVRKVLSAISNRELLNNATQAENRFWNNNMWVMEDLGFTNRMVQPVKTLNLDSFVEKASGYKNSEKFEELEIVFVPGHVDEYTIDENRLVINFFKVMPDLYDEDKVTIAGKDFIEYIEEKLVELLEK